MGQVDIEGTRNPVVELSYAVLSELQLRGGKTPSLKILTALLSETFYVTLERDEGHPILFDLIYLDPDNPDSDPPLKIRSDRWQFIPFDQPAPFESSTVSKLALATDKRTSLLAVYPDKKDRLMVWGFVDQGTNTELFQSLESNSGFSHPGMFHVCALAPGHLTVSIEFETIAELKGHTLMTKPLPVFEKGALVKALTPAFKNLSDMKEKYLVRFAKMELDNDELEGAIVQNALNDLRRLIMRINSYGHGGAVLITPDIGGSNLKVKHRLVYKRLSEAIVKESVLADQSWRLRDKIFTFMESEQDLPLTLYFNNATIEGELEDSKDEVAGTLWFTSLLSRVDGLILMDTSLNIVGFGVEILEKKDPKRVWFAGDVNASKTKRTRLNPEDFGTRHRSMMRYCAAVPGAVGFVISQDGGVRIMTCIKDDLVVWTNVQLKLDFRSKSRLKQAPLPDEEVIEKVRKTLPTQPWPKGTAKEVATKLGISTTQMNRVTQELIRRKVFKPQINGVLYDLDTMDTMSHL